MNRDYYAARIVELENTHDYLRKRYRKQIGWLAIFVGLCLWCIGWAIYGHDTFMWFLAAATCHGSYVVWRDTRQLRRLMIDCALELDKLERLLSGER
jgi:hypothetical protein